MTHDEMIEAAGLAIEDQLTLEDGWLVGTPQLKGMCQDFARAAIRVIAPAVLEEVHQAQRDCEYPTDLPQWAVRANISRGDYVCAWEDGSQAVEEVIRDLKTRYEQ